jgi:hypothetical protein
MNMPSVRLHVVACLDYFVCILWDFVQPCALAVPCSGPEHDGLTSTHQLTFLMPAVGPLATEITAFYYKNLFQT